VSADRARQKKAKFTRANLPFLLRFSIVTEAGMYALRERRQHVTQEDFELAVSKVRIVMPMSPSGSVCLPNLSLFSIQILKKASDSNMSSNKLFT
jgi:ATP-dependent 26S proteasome regulatory subunit